MQIVAVIALLGIFGCGSFLTQTEEPQAKKSRDCDELLEQAEVYDITNDPRAEATYRSIALTHGKECPRVFLHLSSHLSRNLKFKEASEMMGVYVKRVPAKDRVFDNREVKKLKYIGDLQVRVNASSSPRLTDLLELARHVGAYGRKSDYAVPYAEKALGLYPNSVAAILLLVDLLPRTLAQKERVEQLLNRAAATQPNDARIYSTRGWWNLRTFRNLEDAERNFRRALSVSHDTDLSAWRGLGFVLMERGRKQDALVAFRRYLTLRKATTPDYEVNQSIENLERNPIR